MTADVCDRSVKEMQMRQFTNDPRVPGETYGFEEQKGQTRQEVVHGLSNLPLSRLCWRIAL